MKIQEISKFSSLIHKFKHGSKFPLQVHWVSSSGLKISTILGVLSVVGIILGTKDNKFRDFVYVLLSSNKGVPSPRGWSVPGLQNYGNNCFLNVILQALASCSRFQKYLGEILEEYELSSVEGGDQTMPLVNSLTSLVEELCTVRHRKTAISPRNVMIALDHYMPNFNLTRQQDAEEAFTYLLSLLREELSEHYVPNKRSLSDLPAFPYGRIITKSSEEETDTQRWRRIFLGPFDGILGSIIICRSCSFQISLDFQQFHSLHFSPPTSSDGAIVDGCTLEDCLKHFFAAERLENYHCCHCWHIAAIKYVSAIAGDTTDTETLQNCSRNDSCHCKTLSSLEAFPWSNMYSHTFRKQSLARSPKILCIHLQRASLNLFGQSVKLQGHLSFPSVLDMSPFINFEAGNEKREKIFPFGTSNEKFKNSYPNLKNQNLQHDLGMPLAAKSFSSEPEAPGEHGRNATICQDGHCAHASEGGSSSLNSSPHSDGNFSSSLKASEAGPSSLVSTRFGEGNSGINLPPMPLKRQNYRLVSVVEHFGSGHSGHYTVYRKVTAKIDDEDPVALLESAIEEWYCISDSDVNGVSEKDVLGANASILFYERMNDSRF
ncbi:ubiquitin carboxyl-terminal hydrolase 27-like [Dorcoceras hygrometricum]|uniref:Ubiquitin carboxyl-terminal hydrolase n=1 Tax=Dorcoceras hygrometricum TaxID=472368 RepID=A0A2Z7BMM5_9LAMI|nr:ubiquitin carboxyl-terminal hydrolase 27-like [Dorcoceras hygrometricum]